VRLSDEEVELACWRNQKGDAELFVKLAAGKYVYDKRHVEDAGKGTWYEFAGNYWEQESSPRPWGCFCTTPNAPQILSGLPNWVWVSVVSGSKCRTNVALRPPLEMQSVFPGNADRRVGLSSTGKDTMLPLHFKHFFPWFVAKLEARCRAVTAFPG
jgi:hypothetical protein